MNPTLTAMAATEREIEIVRGLERRRIAHLARVSAARSPIGGRRTRRASREACCAWA